LYIIEYSAGKAHRDGGISVPRSLLCHGRRLRRRQRDPALRRDRASRPGEPVVSDGGPAAYRDPAAGAGRQGGPAGSFAAFSETFQAPPLPLHGVSLGLDENEGVLTVEVGAPVLSFSLSPGSMAEIGRTILELGEQGAKPAA
jgi:hypothetical protein